jgi:hypothetical protein
MGGFLFRRSTIRRHGLSLASHRIALFGVYKGVKRRLRRFDMIPTFDTHIVFFRRLWRWICSKWKWVELDSALLHNMMKSSRKLFVF